MNRSLIYRLGAATLFFALILAGCSSPAVSTAPAAAPSSPPTTATTAAPAAVTASATATTAASGATSTAPAATATTAASGTTNPPAAGATPSTSAAIPNSGVPAGEIAYVIQPDKSSADYRVREQLASLSMPSDAVGKTSQISGSVMVKADGSIDPNSKITVDISNLQSDRSMRDNYVRRNILHADQYPSVVFVPTQVSGLAWPLPQSGNVTFQVTGNLTIQDVTKPVTWDVSGTIQGDQATGQAKTTFTFEDFNLDQPRVPVVLSVEDHITLEANVTFQRASSSGQTPGSGASANTADQTVAVTGSSAQANQSSQTGAQCTAPAKATPPMTEGPYFKAGSPEQTNLVQPGMGGTKLTLTGYVLTPDCQLVANALVDFWQADAQGRYDNSGYTLRGHQLTDASGRYQLVTVIPGLYPGRTEHIHVKVQPPNGAVLTTQLFFPGVAQNQSDGIFDPSLVITIQDGAGGKQGSFNFIVNQ